MKQSTLLFSICLLLVVSCKPKQVTSEADAGEIDPSVYVAIGGSSTAGVLDDALSFEGQENSLAAILANQLAMVGGIGFSQPLMSESSVGVSIDGKSKFNLGYKTDCKGVTSLSPIRAAASGDQASWNSNMYSLPYRNMGIPNLKSTDFSTVGYGNPANGAGNYNPYYARMTSSQEFGFVMGDIMANQPTFFSLFIGMDEVLDYAKKGASIGAMTPVNGASGVGFDGSIENILDNLSGVKGVVSTIPDVTEMPYFTTIPYNGLVLDEESAQTLNDIYNPLDIYFQVGNNPFVIMDPTAGDFGVRQMVEGELILLSVPLDSVKCYKMGSIFPFRDEFILEQAELAQIRSTVDAYNSILIAAADEHNLALASGHTFYKKLKSGIVFNGISIDARFVSGGAYSLDGIHLTPRTNALFANEFIKAINTHYNARIPLADATRYRGIIFP